MPARYHWDAIVIGSGFGGAMSASPLVQSGMRVLMLERGGWVGRGPENWTDRGAGLVTPFYTKESPYIVHAKDRRSEVGAWNCVGGQSVFYGGASYRFRESDFGANDRIVGDSRADWPFTYDDIEPYYALAERLLGVAGEEDVSDPRRSTPFPQNAPPLSASSIMIANAAVRAGMTPSRIPLAISFDGSGSMRACMKCGTCDGYACAAEAKNDLATGMIPRLIRQGMTLRANTVCVRLVRSGSRIVAVDYVDRISGQSGKLEADTIVLAAGTLATPHLLLASNLSRSNPAPHTVGRFLTRHRNSFVFGVFARKVNPQRAFDKQVAVLDHYEEAGSIQQMSPSIGVVRSYLPHGLRSIGARVIEHSSGLLAMAEDQPRQANGVDIDWAKLDRFGLPSLHVTQSYSPADERSIEFLVRAAKSILREAGARLTFTHRITTFSHALGTVRMGRDESSSPLDGDGRFRGIDNLFVADGSALPRSAGVNPSLTIAANALRIGGGIAGSTLPRRRRALRTLEFARDLSTVSD
jgi:choline dehydrogenase-like flavoprotein